MSVSTTPRAPTAASARGTSAPGPGALAPTCRCPTALPTRVRTPHPALAGEAAVSPALHRGSCGSHARALPARTHASTHTHRRACKRVHKYKRACACTLTPPVTRHTCLLQHLSPSRPQAPRETREELLGISPAVLPLLDAAGWREDTTGCREGGRRDPDSRLGLAAP